MATPAFAGEPCSSAKNLVKVGQNFYGDNPDLTNIITPEFKLALKGLNGSETPSAIMYRHEGTDIILPVVDGELTGIEKIATQSKDGEMCRMIGDEIGPTTEEDTVEANMNFSFTYKRTDGIFSMDEIKEGAKDGSKIMSGLAPGGLGFVVPGLKALALGSVEGSEIKPTFSFSRKGEPVSVKTFTSGTTTLIRLKDIKSAKADMLKIDGDYLLQATFKFDPEKLAEAEAKRAEKAAETDE